MGRPWTTTSFSLSPVLWMGNALTEIALDVSTGLENMFVVVSCNVPIGCISTRTRCLLHLLFAVMPDVRDTIQQGALADGDGDDNGDEDGNDGAKVAMMTMTMMMMPLTLHQCSPLIVLQMGMDGVFVGS